MCSVALTLLGRGEKTALCVGYGLSGVLDKASAMKCGRGGEGGGRDIPVEAMSQPIFCASPLFFLGGYWIHILDTLHPHP